jgi:hypothetical protein
VDKRTAQQPKVQQFESAGFQDPQAAAETSGNYYYSYDGKSAVAAASRGYGKKKRGEVKKKLFEIIL